MFGRDRAVWLVALKRFLRKENPWNDDDPPVDESSRLWSEADNIITFSVTSDGTTGEVWIERLEKKGFRVGDYGSSVI